MSAASLAGLRGRFACRSGPRPQLCGVGASRCAWALSDPAFFVSVLRRDGARDTTAPAETMAEEPRPRQEEAPPVKPQAGITRVCPR